MVIKLILLAGMAIIHLIGSQLRFLQGIPRSIWLSIAGGASVSYIFLHLLPELIEASKVVDILEHELLIFFIALVGLCFIYGLENVANSHKKGNEDEVYWVHMGSYSIYNFIIGYLLVNRSDENYISLLLYFLAMSLHFIVNDYSLLEHHKSKYLKYGRWIVAAAVIAGGAIAALTEVSDQWIHLGMAFISGGVIMNVLKEELPENRKSRYWAFLLGVILYSSLLFLLTTFK